FCFCQPEPGNSARCKQNRALVMKDNLQENLFEMMSEIEWNCENEIQLFYAMMGHKPVGINKHFQMMMIHEKLSSSLGVELPSSAIWKKLETLYDLNALDDSNILPFPNDRVDFTLPKREFSDILDERGMDPRELSDEKDQNKMKPKLGRPPKKAEEGGYKKDRMRDDDEDTPSRLQKRGRDSKPASPANTPTQKRRKT
ncbi:unnamed protein product, partial [Meganyctiphanes norvegica]